MTHKLLFILATLALTGCASQNESSATSGKPLAKDEASLPNSATELAAFAGNAKYPAETQPAGDLKLAAIVAPDQNTIRIYNFTQQNIRDARVWVNRSYVKPIGGIAPGSRVLIRTDELYNGLGHSLASRKEQVTNVTVQVGDTIYTVMGPAPE